MNRYESLAITVGTAFFAFSLSVFVFSFPPQRVEAEGLVRAHTDVGRPIRPLELHVANNGLVLLRSARVVSVNGSTIIVSTAWGSADFRWTVRTDAKSYESRSFGTRFIDRDSKKSSLDDIKIGSLITITGTLDYAAQNPTLDADSVRSLEA